MSTLTPNSHIIKAVQNHLDTGIPIDSYNLTPQEVQRIEAVFHLYKAWKQNPFVDKKSFLQYVHNRRTQDIPSDLYLFDFIKNTLQEALTISRTDAEYIHDQYTRKLLQAGDSTGDASLWDKGLKHLEKSKKIGQDAPPEELAKNTAILPAVLTTDVKHIDKERENASLERQRAILKRFGGKRDTLADRIEELKQDLLSTTTVPDSSAVGLSTPVSDASPSAVSTVPEDSSSGS